MTTKHKFQVGDKVKLPGTQIKTTGHGYKNKFSWNVTGTIQALGWSKPQLERVKIQGSGRAVTTNADLTYTEYLYEVISIKRPLYKVNGLWYGKDQVQKLLERTNYE